MTRLAIIGSTGSIGRQALDVVRNFPGELEVVALCAGQNRSLLAEQIAEFSPAWYSCTGLDGEALSGARPASPAEIAALPEVDIVVAAMAGSAGMESIVAALRAGKSVALANKEPVVMAGGSLMRLVKDYLGCILPIDSEPSAIWQCIQGEISPARRIIITASGGAFRDRSWESLRDVSPAEALKHPTWQMGKKITIDSATLMNKAFEVIESHWLFDMAFDQIEVVIHRQSVIHSMVEFADGSVKAQMGPPDMRFPIQYALFHPGRRGNPRLPRFDPVKTGSLTFEQLRPSVYPCFELALEYAKRGGTWPAVLTGADEAAVRLFLEEKIRFTDIPDVIARVLSGHQPTKDPSVSECMQAADQAFTETLHSYQAK